MRKPLFLLVLAAALLARGAAAQDETNSGIAPRWLDPPVVDGRCDDAAYERGGSLAMRDGQVAVVHSSVDLYLCLDKLSGGVERISVGLDPDLSRDGSVGTGDYVFRFKSSGEVYAERGDGDGRLVDLAISEDDAAVAFSEDSAEMRISLEWLGGYARTAGLGLSVEGGDGRSWPEAADALAPGSWGELALEPVYAEGIAAGSIFLDGREGHLVVPYAPELSPRELTVEAWVRVVDGDCGTLVGNGQTASYWLALCEGVRFGHGGASTVRSVPHPLGNGWHHVAATFDAAGVRTLYVDGTVVLQPGWEPPHESDEGEVRSPIRLGSSILPLRIGSDRDDPDSLHGYVRELRIWSRARTAGEIRETAFESLRGGEPDLVALWPFTSDLRDLAGGHHAGLIGSASLAREAPQVTKFPDPPARQPWDYPARLPVPAWNARVSAVANENAMKLDGDCTRAEYARAAKLTMEPDRSVHMKMLVAGNALYLCTNLVVGKAGSPGSSVTLWIDRDNKPATQPGSSELRIRLTPDGKLQVGTGNGLGYTGPAPSGIQAKALSGNSLQAQEDLRRLTAPWWSGEIRIPLTALSPFVAGSPLRLALAYDGEAPAESGLPPVVRARWPASFQELRSDTWGVAATDRPSQQAVAAASDGDLGTVNAALISSSPRTPVSSATALPGFPRPASPTEADFDGRCPWWLTPSYVFDEDLKWPLVDENRPVIQVSGTLTKVYVSAEDSSYIHMSHDVDMKLGLHPDDVFAALNSGSNLVLETESLGFPPRVDRRQGARPTVDDHVTVLGRWIFDCGHEAKTEVHPIPLFESDRLEVRPLWPGGPQRTVRVVRVWMNSDPEPFGYEFTGAFIFEVDLPPAGWAPFLRVVEGERGQVSATRNGNRVQISVDPPESTGEFYFEMMVGHLAQPEDHLSDTWQTAVVNSWEVEVLDDHDHGFPPDCLSLSLTEDCGEIYYAVNANGTWRQLLWNEQIPSTQSRVALESFTLAGPNLQLLVTGYEEDPTLPHGGGEPLSPDPDDDEAFVERGSDLGSLDQNLGQRVLDSPGGDWRLHYHISPGGEMPASLQNQGFWEPRLEDEPNDSTPIGLSSQPLAVPPPNAAALVTRRDGFLTEPGASFPLGSEVTLFSSEVDRYRFSLADFADVEFATLPPPLVLDVKTKSAWHHSPPQTLKVQTSPGQSVVMDTDDVLGFSAANLRVSSSNGLSGDAPYTVEVRTRYREVPRDWGEYRDVTGLTGGRVIDLATVPPNPAADPRLRIEPASLWFPEKRELAADWAWQHIATDTDLYRVIVPPVPGPPAGHTPCQFDNLGRLIVRAHPMTISIPALGLSGDGIVIHANLRQALPNGGSLIVQVSASAPPRRLYQLEAEWDGTRYYTQAECEEMRRQMAMIRRLTPEGELEIMKGLIALQGREIPGERPPWPGPDPAPTELPVLGDFRAIRTERGGPLDLIISSPEDQPVIARLFDDQGLLLGESDGLDEASAGETPAPAGLVPHTRLRADSLEAGRTYLLQVVPRNREQGRQQVPLGFGER